MTPSARNELQSALTLIAEHNYFEAIISLRYALKHISHPRAYSKIMLALRAMYKLVPKNERPV